MPLRASTSVVTPGPSTSFPPACAPDAVRAALGQRAPGAGEELGRDVRPGVREHALAPVEDTRGARLLDPGRRTRRAQPAVLLGTEGHDATTLRLELAQQHAVGVRATVVAAVLA